MAPRYCFVCPLGTTAVKKAGSEVLVYTFAIQVYDSVSLANPTHSLCHFTRCV